MNIRFFIWIFLWGCVLSYGQEKFTLSGKITDAQTGESLMGVSFSVMGEPIGTSTNEYGFYSLTLPKGEYRFVIQYLGFETIEKTIKLEKDIREDYTLNPSVTTLEAVEVNANTPKANVRKPEMSVNKVSVSTIKKLPVILGEVDIVKSLLQLPGVTNAGEGASGFNVRGGSADQNLILLDEAVLYNASHVFGFFSVFNADAIRDITLYKGGIPARYGGRVSSVLDIYQKEGNKNKFSAMGGIGLISSRLLLEGPIKKEKSSFLIGGRSSYAHLFLKLKDKNSNSAYFYDLNTKFSYRLNANNTLYLSGYFGRDFFTLNENFTNVFGNAFGNLRWNHLFSDKLFSNLSLIYSDYYYGLDLDFVGFSWRSSIQNFNLKYDFRHYLSDKTKLSYGLQGIHYTFDPGRVVPIGKSTLKERDIPNKYALETSIYSSLEHRFSKNLTIYAGLRYSRFYRLGQEDVFIYDNDQPVKYLSKRKKYYQGEPIRTEHYGRNSVIDVFQNLEPRFSASYAFNDDHSVKASYNRMAQYLHLISNTTSPTPLDVWAPAGRYLKPLLLDQYAIGYASNWKQNQYSFETEMFYKKAQNRLDYIDGADLIANKAIERVVLLGEMRAYGWEVLFRKNTGKLTGWVAYTLSRAEQRVPGRTPDEVGINKGKWYKTNYDKTHDLSIVGLYKWNKKWTFGASFTYQSGLPGTFPKSKYIYGDMSIPNYGLRNEALLPAYHRLDISATLTPYKNQNRRWKTEWVFGIYNVYNRMNATSITFRQNKETGKNEATRLSIFGIVPSVTYNFKF